MVKKLINFNKILNYIENIKLKVKDEDKTLLLLNLFPETFEHFKDVLSFKKEQTVTLDEIQTSIQTKELQKLQESKALFACIDDTVDKDLRRRISKNLMFSLYDLKG